MAEAIERCEAIREEVRGNLHATADVLQPLAGLHAMEGRFDEARALLATSDAAFEELGLTLSSAVSHHAAMVELLAGDPAAAERHLRKGYAALEEMGDKAVLSTTAAFLGQALLAQGDDEEAGRFAELSAELAGDDDMLTQSDVARRAGARFSRGAAGSRRPSGSRGRRSRWPSETDFLNHRAEALVVLGGVLGQRERSEAARARRSREALRLYEQKGNLRGRDPAARRPCPVRPRLRRSARVMAASKFFEVLPLLKDENTQVGVCAMGPVGTGDTIIWMRVWVWQQDGDNIAASAGQRGRAGSRRPPLGDEGHAAVRAPQKTVDGADEARAAVRRLHDREARARPGDGARGERRRAQHRAVEPGRRLREPRGTAPTTSTTPRRR